MTELIPEDAKLVVLARATRARTGATSGAALRDLDGRTYAAAEVGQFIPADAFGAVAEILAHVYRATGRQPAAA